MPNGMTPEQAAMANQFYAARRRARQEEEAQQAAQAVSVAQSLGSRGQQMKKRRKKKKAGLDLSSAPGGAPTEEAPQPAQAPPGATGRAAISPSLKGGSQLARTPTTAKPRSAKTAQPKVRTAKQSGKQSKSSQGGRLQNLAMKKMQARVAAAGGEEGQMRGEQMKRAIEAAKKIKKVAKAASATAVVTIIFIILSYIKDYILGNLIYNGDPTGVFSKKEANYLGYKVTPLHPLEVFILFSVLGEAFLHLVMINIVPIIIICIIIFTVVGLNNLPEIIDLVKEIGVEALAPIVQEFGGQLNV